MKYIVKPGTESHAKLKDLFTRFREISAEINNFCRKYKAIDYIIDPNREFIFGSIRGFVFASQRQVPPHWAKVKGTRNAYFPKNYEQNKEALAEIKAIGKIELSKYNECIELTPPEGKEDSKYGVFHVESLDIYCVECITTEVAPDLEEILESQFLNYKEMYISEVKNTVA